MLALAVVAVIIGIILASVTGIGMVGIVVAVIFFICGLPGAIIASFVHGEVEYAQDRADYRQLLSDLARAEEAEDREYAEDARLDRYIRSNKRQPPQITYDNRQIHYHGGRGQ
jgi:hypothetical protein